MEHLSQQLEVVVALAFFVLVAGVVVLFSRMISQSTKAFRKGLRGESDVLPSKVLREERECPHCAEPILARAKVCKHCGREVIPRDAAREPPTREVSQPRRLERTRGVVKTNFESPMEHYGGLIIFVLLVVLGTAWYFATPGHDESTLGDSITVRGRAPTEKAVAPTARDSALASLQALEKWCPGKSTADVRQLLGTPNQVSGPTAFVLWEYMGLSIPDPVSGLNVSRVVVAISNGVVSQCMQ